MQSINRTAVIIIPKQPFVDWINSIVDNRKYTIENITKDNLTFLIPEFDTPNEVVNYIKKNYSLIFEYHLWGWITDENLYPKNRSWKMFNDWFDIKINSEVYDLVGEEVEKEEV